MSHSPLPSGIARFWLSILCRAALSISSSFSVPQRPSRKGVAHTLFLTPSQLIILPNSSAGRGPFIISVMQFGALRHDWTREEVRTIYNTRLLDALFAAQAAHRQYFEPDEVQLCQLLSIKTGGCPEDCAYCPQSAHYDTAVDREPLLAVAHVMNAAHDA